MEEIDAGRAIEERSDPPPPWRVDFDLPESQKSRTHHPNDERLPL